MLGIAVVLVLAAFRLSQGDLDSKGLTSYVTGLVVLIDPIAHLTTNYNEFQQGQASLRRLRAIEREPSEPADPDPAFPLDRLRGDLVFSNVRFGYRPDQFVLHDLNLTIEAGSVVALVGPSGAGKSTLFSLVLRFNTAQSGQVLFDGKNLAQVRARDLRQQVALVPQRSGVFSGTIAEAIRFGRR